MQNRPSTTHTTLLTPSPANSALRKQRETRVRVRSHHRTLRPEKYITLPSSALTARRQFPHRQRPGRYLPSTSPLCSPSPFHSTWLPLPSSVLPEASPGGRHGDSASRSVSGYDRYEPCVTCSELVLCSIDQPWATREGRVGEHAGLVWCGGWVYYYLGGTHVQRDADGASVVGQGRCQRGSGAPGAASKQPWARSVGRD
jgi:hypothetical protein